jgi:hypothetical protein
VVKDYSLMLHALILARSSVEAKPHIKYKSAPPDLKEG